MKKLMKWYSRNRTAVQEFILEGFPAVQHLGNILFLVHLLAYLASIMGNTLIITITWADHRLHAPMYFFLSTFSFVETCCISTVIPKLLTIFLSGKQAISFAACFTQAFFFLFLGSTAFFLMAVLSLDRYLAICRPLRYSSIMSPRVCSLLVSACFTLGFVLAVAPVVHLSQLSFCGTNVIPHFFCDFGPLAKLSCSDTRCVEMLFFDVAFFGYFYIPPCNRHRVQPHRSHHREAPVSQGATESFLHLLVSPHHPLSHVQQLSFHLCEAKADEQGGLQQTGCSGEHGADPSAEPCHLHPAQPAGAPGSQGCPVQGEVEPQLLQWRVQHFPS